MFVRLAVLVVGDQGLLPFELRALAATAAPASATAPPAPAPTRRFGRLIIRAGCAGRSTDVRPFAISWLFAICGERLDRSLIGFTLFHAFDRQHMT